MKFPKIEVKKRSEGSGGSEMFLKIQDGESKILICRGERYEYAKLWNEGRSTVVPAGTPGASRAFRMNVVVNESGKLVPKVWEFGVIICNMLADIHEEHPLDVTTLKVIRRGTGKDTEYGVLTTSKEKFSKEQLAEIAKLPLLNLEARPAVIEEAV
jgi:hypothetical protein